MTRTHGRAPRGRRLVAKAPHGHWRTLTFLAALRKRSLAPSISICDGFYGALARRIHEHGIPVAQAELVRDMLHWFDQRHIDHHPDESAIKQKIKGDRRELHRD